MSIQKIKINDLEVSRLILGGNPFSGFSHQGLDRDDEMLHYFTVAKIKDTLNEAESHGINTFLGRADRHIVRMLLEYHDEGGEIQWFAQTCPEMLSTERSIQDAVEGGASAAYIHGGVMDYLLAQNKLDEVPALIDQIKDAGLPAGVAGHDPRVFEWAKDNIDVDFYMCSYYNASHRDEGAEHVHGRPEWFNSDDRDIMVKLIQGLSKPVIHYKVLAAGRNEPAEAIEFSTKHMRSQDAMCIGVFSKDNPDILSEDVELFEKNIRD